MSAKGVEQAYNAAVLLRDHGFSFDVAFTSVLQRSITTYYTIADELDQIWIPHHKHYRLNSRHYGALQGLTQQETELEYG